MAKRFSLLYRFSTDNGLSWVDLTPQVDSLQTSMTHSLCTNNFTSAKDELTFVMPETPLFYPDGTSTPKKLLIDALFGDDDILVQVNAPFVRRQVVWDDDDVLWKGDHVMWSGTGRRFTGYVDRSSFSVKSWPLPPNLTVKLQDCSTLHLDDKVDQHICWEDYTIKQIVRNLLSYAGYDATNYTLSDVDTTVMSATDNVQLEAFVVDKDKAQTYRQYIDTLLFEAGGYVIDFNEYGMPVLTHINWDGSVAANRIIDNPMNSEGVTLKGAWLKEDGAKLYWSSLAWSGSGQKIWQSSISQEIDSGELVGDIVKPGYYWPENGELAPQYFQYDPKLLDTAYLTRASRKQNEDLTIIMAKDISVRMDAMQNGNPFTGWSYVDPTSWPAGDNWNDKYGIPTNPTLWPTKAWYLLYNGTASDVNLTFFTIYGNVLYRQKLNTLQTEGSKNPKEYESTYIYDSAQAARFLQFWWHFLQTSRYQFSWTEPNVYDGLNDVVSVGIKGNSSSQKAVVVSKTSKWINDNAEIVSFTAVGIDPYVAENLIPTVIAPSSSTPQVQTVNEVKTATFSTTPSYTLAQWENFVNIMSTWTITNSSIFNVGDTAAINGVISDMDDLAVTLYLSVTGVDAPDISGTGIKIYYVPVIEEWDFDMSPTSVTCNLRQGPYSSNDPDSYTEVMLESKQRGHGNVLEYWTCTGTPGKTFFTGDSSQSTTGSKPRLRICKDETVDYVTVRMYDNNNPSTVTVSKKIAIVDQTVYDHDFGAWTPEDTGTVVYVVPDHFMYNGIPQAVIDGDFFVSKGFATSGTAIGSPTGNPHENGYHERGGAGTVMRPYFYFLSSDTTVDGGKTYYTPGGDIYTEGIPYIYENNSWHNEMAANQANSNRLLRCLGNVLNTGLAVPATAALWGWFENLVALNAIISNLFARNVTVGDGDGTAGSGFRFRAHAYDSSGNKLTNPIFDIMYGASTLFNVDIITGEIYFGTGFRYDPSYDGGLGAIRSTEDGVVINANGDIDISRGAYRSTLICPSFRSEPRGSIISPTTVNISGNRYQQSLQLYTAVPPASGFSARPCTKSNDSSVKYMDCVVSGSGHYAQYIYRFYNVNMSSVGVIVYSESASYVVSSWENTTFILTVGTTTNVTFRFVNDSSTPALSIGTDPSNLLTGELYYSADGGGTGTLHIKL